MKVNSPSAFCGSQHVFGGFYDIGLLPSFVVVVDVVVVVVVDRRVLQVGRTLLLLMMLLLGSLLFWCFLVASACTSSAYGLAAYGMAIFQSPKNIFQRPRFTEKSSDSALANPFFEVPSLTNVMRRCAEASAKLGKFPVHA